MNSIIEFKNIKKAYDKETIIDKFNIEINKGEFLTIIGSSGCGKTTMLKMINGLILPDKGEILVKGKKINEVDIINHRRNTGYVIQGSTLFPHMTVGENISYIPNLYKKNNRKCGKNLVKKWLETVGLTEELIGRYPNELSGGQQQRVGIARALINSPEILLMDEPFGAVDEITRRQLQDEIIKIHKETGITILFVTHDISEAIKLGTKVLVMNQGKIEQYDTSENILKNPRSEFVKKLILQI